MGAPDVGADVGVRDRRESTEECSTRLEEEGILVIQGGDVLFFPTIRVGMLWFLMTEGSVRNYAVRCE